MGWYFVVPYAVLCQFSNKNSANTHKKCELLVFGKKKS